MKKTPWNEGWEFYPAGSETQRRAVVIPHDAMIREPRDPSCDNSYNSGYFPGGTYVYEKKFRPEEAWREKTVLVEFEGVYRNSSVTLNGTPVGGHVYGYSQFTVDLSGALLFGQENILTVTADNSQTPNSRWYSGSGIYRPVSLYVGNPVHLEPDGTVIRTLETDGRSARISLEASVCGPEGVQRELRIAYEVRRDGKKIAEAEGLHVEITVPNPALWSAETPNLYTCAVRLFSGGECIDSSELAFGIRTLTWDAERGLCVNGRRVLLNGGCLHHDHGILGAAGFEEAERRRVRILKEAGFNAVRSSHNPVSQAMLKACDELGMYVMDETFDMWLMQKTRYDYSHDFREHYLDDTARMVRKDRNHPSVILYSIGNEIADTASPRAGVIAGRMIETIRALDSTRPVIDCVNLSSAMMAAVTDLPVEERDEAVESAAGANTMLEKDSSDAIMRAVDRAMPLLIRLKKAETATDPIFRQTDVAGLNYCNAGPGRFHKAHPERLFCFSETYPKDIAENWKTVRENPYVLGDFVWTAWDYIGETSLGAWSYGEESAAYYKAYPALLAGSGLVDITGRPGTEVAYRKAITGQLAEPCISVRPLNRETGKTHRTLWRMDDGIESWAWDHCEGKRAEITVYAQGKTVELSLNGRVIGRRKLKNGSALFRTAWESGALTARVLDAAGRCVGESTLRSAGTEELLTARQEAPEGSRLLFFNLTVEDGNGVVHANADHRIAVSVDGPGVLMGVASANPITEDALCTHVCTTYYGRAQAVVLRTGEGEIRLSVKDAEGSASSV